MEWVVVIEAVSLEGNGDRTSLFSELLFQLSAFDGVGLIDHDGHLIRMFVKAVTGSEAIAKALIVTSRAQTSLEMPSLLVVAIGRWMLNSLLHKLNGLEST